MPVHFVCAGNTYRSRLAEALLHGHALPALRASSSGIRSAWKLNGPVRWTALRLLKRDGLIPFMSPHWTQTTPELLMNADLVMFMEPAIHAACVSAFAFAGAACEVWDVPDVGDPRFPEQQAAPGDEPRLIAITEAAFARPKREVAALAERLRAGTAGARGVAGVPASDAAS